MAVNQDYLDFIIDQMSSFEGFETKKMFGGIGFFKEGIMFGLLGKNVFHLRTDDTNREDFEAHGMKGFMASETKKGMPYFEVPVNILENKDEFTLWVAKSYEVAVNNKK